MSCLSSCLPPGGVQPRNPGDAALYRLCVWSLHKWTRCTVSRLSTRKRLAGTFQRLFDTYSINTTSNTESPPLNTHTCFCRPTVPLQSHLSLLVYVLQTHYISAIWQVPNSLAMQTFLNTTNLAVKLQRNKSMGWTTSNCPIYYIKHMRLFTWQVWLMWDEFEYCLAKGSFISVDVM